MTRLFTSSIKKILGLVASLALALGIGVAASSPASAAGTVWDRVARCESSGNWRINTGNGYYGGLQFSYSTWRGFGGQRYARTANRASKAQQIAIARRVLAVQGPGAWPVCSRRAGLTKANGHASRTATPATNPGADRVGSSTKRSSSSKVTGKTVRVRSGDTLARIAARHDVRGGWRGLWRLNKNKLSNPHRIYVGQVLRIR